MAAFATAGVEPFGSAIEALERWSDEPGEEWERIADDAEAGDETDALLLEDLPIGDGTPYLNPLRDVGRNDPCPCGSGKKYKKCCLAA